MKRIFGNRRLTEELPPLYRYAQTLTRDASAAEDLVHDTLIRAYEAREGFRRGANPRPWLCAIMYNLFVSGWRRSAAERRRDDEAAHFASHIAPPNQEAAVRLAAIAEAFETLSPEHRAALHLVVVEGQSYQEAADALGVPIGTLISRLSRARSALRAQERMPRQAGRPMLRLVGDEGR